MADFHKDDLTDCALADACGEPDCKGVLELFVDRQNIGRPVAVSAKSGVYQADTVVRAEDIVAHGFFAVAAYLNNVRDPKFKSLKQKTQDKADQSEQVLIAAVQKLPRPVLSPHKGLVDGVADDLANHGSPALQVAYGQFAFNAALQQKLSGQPEDTRFQTREQQFAEVYAAMPRKTRHALKEHAFNTAESYEEAQQAHALIEAGRKEYISQQKNWFSKGAALIGDRWKKDNQPHDAVLNVYTKPQP